MSPSSTKSSPSSGSITLLRASCTSSTVGMGTRIVGSAHAPSGAACAVHSRTARGAVRDPQGRRRDRRDLDDSPARGRLRARFAAAPRTGKERLATLQYRARRGQDAPPRGDRRSARRLRRGLSDHARLHHGRGGDRPADTAHAGGGEAPAGEPPGPPARRGGHQARAHALRRRGHRSRGPVPTGDARAVSDPALALSFFDQAREIYGTARSGTTILFEGRRPVPHAEGPALRRVGGGWRGGLARGLELWLPGEELPHRGSGMVIAGSSLDLEGLRVHTAVFRWRLDGRDGIGAYELMVRTEPPAAA